jgi:CTD nuclear envelope phosphatase 1
MNSVKVLVDSLDNLYPANDDSLRGVLKELVDEDDDELLTTEQIVVPTSSLENHDARLATASPSVLLSPSRLPQQSLSWVSWLAHVVLFVPNYLMVKPMMIMIYIVCYPFKSMFVNLGLRKPDSYSNPLLLEKHSLKNNKEIDKELEKEAVADDYDTGNVLNSVDSKSDIAIDHDTKTERLKQENILANTVKSPTSSSKYIIPPPQRLYPLSRNPQRKRKKKVLILDLDETLIHSVSRASPRSFATSSGAPKMIEIKLNNVATLYYVHKRPYCDFFLQEISKWYELQIFTASVREYADPIIDWLEQDVLDYYEKKSSSPINYEQRPRVFTKRYYRQDCTYRSGVGYIKDLSKFFIKEDELKNVIILDNSPVSYALHEDNAVVIEGWINDQGDRDLLNLLPMLHSLSLCIDVRYILGLRNGEKTFEQ